jgi:hypothetical protein
MELTSSTASNLQDIEDLTISLIIRNFNPTLLTYELLTMSGIVPNSWELAKKPMTSPRGSQIAFKNGIEIVAQGNTLNFRQPFNIKDLEKLEVANVVKQYVSKMGNAEYLGLTIAPKIIIPFTEEQGGQNFIHQTFFNDGLWRNFGKNSVQASLSLSYELDDCRLGVNINPAKLQQPNKNPISAVLFAGNFNYNFMNEQPEIANNNLMTQINNWQKNIEIFRDLVYQKFLQKAPQQQESLFDT